MKTWLHIKHVETSTVCPGNFKLKTSLHEKDISLYDVARPQSEKGNRKLCNHQLPSYLILCFINLGIESWNASVSKEIVYTLSD